MCNVLVFIKNAKLLKMYYLRYKDQLNSYAYLHVYLRHGFCNKEFKELLITV